MRILDVGTQAGASWIVEESLADAESLATLLQQGPLPAEEARRIAGEAASALEKARQRGLHHLRLTPHAVLRTPDGTVKVSGTAIAASMDGLEEPDDVAATRADTVGLVALAYAALTSRWPLAALVHGVDPAPRVVGGVAAPSEIAAGVPSDLDALCRLTLNDDNGPLTPATSPCRSRPGPPPRSGAPATRPRSCSTPPAGPAGSSVAPGRRGPCPSSRAPPRSPRPPRAPRRSPPAPRPPPTAPRPTRAGSSPPR